MPFTTHSQRMQCFRTAGLYLVTSAEHSAGRDTLTIVESALEAGVRLIQLREKGLSCRALVEIAKRVRRATEAYDALLIINDRVDVAWAVEADGVHLGQEDFPIEDARRLNPEWILGASSHNIPEAVAAQQSGASYVNIGPLFATGTKRWGDAYLGIEGLRRIAAAVTIPFTVMGGIKLQHIPELRAAGAQTIAVVTAVTAAPDPAAAAGALLTAVAVHGSRFKVQGFSEFS